ncbi:MAG: single-stranded DNA-binding protein [Bacteroidales bacterium]|jgi:single-strand DNA-binding protein|nr:single-stranded DNA-binding protein [Bacteroidales bacterium]
MINKVILVGNVGADPEVRYINADLPTARIRLATTETYTDSKTGQRVDKTEWHSITVWRGLAKTVEQYVKKGMQLYVEGKITTRSYEKDGATHYTTEIVANEIKFLGRKSDNQSNGSSAQAAPTQAPPAAAPQANSAPAPEPFPAPEDAPADDLPF